MARVKKVSEVAERKQKRQESEKRRLEKEQNAKVRAERLRQMVGDKGFIGTGTLPIHLGLVSDKAVMLHCANLRRRIRVNDLIYLDCAQDPKSGNACVIIVGDDYHIAIAEGDENDVRYVDMTPDGAYDADDTSDDGTITVKPEDYIGTIAYVSVDPGRREARAINPAPAQAPAAKD